MPHVKASVIIPTKQGISSDTVQMGFHFQAPAIEGGTEDAAVADSLRNFFVTPGPGQAATVKQFMSASLNFPLARLKIVSLDAPLPRYPYYDEPLDLGPVSGADNLPAELACVLSFGAPPVTGVPRARLRNRTYIGPLATSSMQQTVQGDTRVSATFRNALLAAAQGLYNAHGPTSTPTNGYRWTVHSTFRNPQAPPRYVAWAYVDDAFDVQRRRGVKRVARTADTSLLTAGIQS